MNFAKIFENTIYFLALINPANKILLLSARRPVFSRKELFSISLRSTVAALVILFFLTSAGNFLLIDVFHVEIYSLSVAGGVIIFLIGLSAVREGKFFYEDPALSARASDISIVPLAAPFIAGPAVITAAISSASIYGITPTLFGLTLAVLVNFALMLLSLKIGRAMEKVNASGPVIRITGLIVTAVAAQMVFSGIETWLRHL